MSREMEQCAVFVDVVERKFYFWESRRRIDGY